jgi:hypothetical protein
VSSKAIASGDGWAESTVMSLSTYAVFGLSRGETDQSMEDIDYGFYTNPGAGELYVFENGVPRGSLGPYAVGD